MQPKSLLDAVAERASLSKLFLIPALAAVGVIVRLLAQVRCCEAPCKHI